jgi:hypothetical protein
VRDVDDLFTWSAPTITICFESQLYITCYMFCDNSYTMHGLVARVNKARGKNQLHLHMSRDISSRQDVIIIVSTSYSEIK